MKGKKGNAIGVSIVLILLLVVGMFAFIGVQQGWFTKQKVTATGTGTGSGTGTGATANPNQGDASSLQIYVVDTANKDKTTKVAVPVYCIDGDGAMIARGDSSSTTTALSVKTTIGAKVTCYAFNSTYQTKTPAVINVDKSYMPVTIEAFAMPTGIKMQVYNDQLQIVSTATAVNLTGVGSDLTATLQKLRIQNNNTQKIVPLAGFYFATIQSSNISSIDVAKGSVALSASTIKPTATARKDNFDYAFEFDNDAETAGNQEILLADNEYVETGAVSIKGNGNGVSSETVSTYGFIRGYYSSSLGDAIKKGIETDASTGTIINGADYTGDSFTVKS